MNDPADAVPKINVNLTPCTCRSITPYGPANIGECINTCPGSPVLVPCALPSTVELTVRLGECDKYPACIGSQHAATCAQRSVRVTCIISGKDWQSSEILTATYSPAPGKMEIELSANLPVFAACQARWEVVKALVLGAGEIPTPPHEWTRWAGLFAQRDAVFAKLCELKRVADAYNAHSADLDEMQINWGKDHYPRVAGCVQQRLHFYVQHLITQVGSLT